MKVHMKRMEPWVIPVTVVSLVLGMLIAVLLRSKLDEYSDSDTSNPIQAIITLQMDNRKLQHDQETLQDQYQKLQKNYEDIITKVASNRNAGNQLVAELNSLRIRAGLIPVQGPGVVITIDDTKSNTLSGNITAENAAPLLTHDIDLMMLVNELRAAGAEAVEINGERIVGSTAIRCVGPSILVNDHKISNPFVVKAIGKADVLSGAVTLPDGVLDGLKSMGIIVGVSKRDLIDIAAIKAPPAIEVAKPAPETPTPETTGGN